MDRTFWISDELVADDLPDGTAVVRRPVTPGDAKLFLSLREKESAPIVAMGKPGMRIAEELGLGTARPRGDERPAIGDLIVTGGDGAFAFFTLTRARFILCTSDGRKVACVNHPACA